LAFSELFDDAADLARLERARGWDLDLAVVGEGVAFDRQRRRRDRQCAAMEIRMRDAADVPKLREDRAANAMHGVGDHPPALDLLR
jgi:hypothetical protein